MTEDYDGDYAKIAIQVIEAGMDDVRIYMDKQQMKLGEVRVENQSLREENTRLHKQNEENWEHIVAERKRLKPDAPLISREGLMLAVKVLEDAGLIGHEFDGYESVDDIRYEIKQVTQPEEV